MKRLNVASAVCLLLLSTGAAAFAQQQQQQQQPVITTLPAGAVAIQSCAWKAAPGAFAADIRIKNYTNLKIAKTRLLLTFIDKAGEAVQGYADMVGTQVALVPGMPLMGKWQHGTFPTSMKTIACGLVGVKFLGYPNVIFSALK